MKKGETGDLIWGGDWHCGALLAWPCPGKSTMTKKSNIATHLHCFFSLSFRSSIFEFLGVEVAGFYSDATISAFDKTEDPLEGGKSKDKVMEALFVVSS